MIAYVLAHWLEAIVIAGTLVYLLTPLERGAYRGRR